MAEKEDLQGITRRGHPRGRGGWAWPSHDFVLMHSQGGVGLEEGEQGRERPDERKPGGFLSFHEPLTPYFWMSLLKSVSLVSKCVVPLRSVK